MPRFTTLQVQIVDPPLAGRTVKSKTVQLPMPLLLCLIL